MSGSGKSLPRHPAVIPATGSQARRQTGSDPGRRAEADVPAHPLRARSGRESEDERMDLIYGRVRLGVMSALAVNEMLTFNDLKALFGVTDGNLSAHARKLEDAGFISCRKSFAAPRPRTEYRLTAAGRRALMRYLEHMEAVIRATRRG
ncbi:MAG TPA: transcriptional regulator [Steroidobacteraceae bacterium]|nr:transcriptional regulator [Steroidobacteraceae bacterium]